MPLLFACGKIRFSHDVAHIMCCITGRCREHHFAAKERLRGFLQQGISEPEFYSDLV